MSFHIDDAMVMFQLDHSPPPVTAALRSAEAVEEHLRQYGSVEIAPYLSFLKERRISGSAFGLLERRDLEQWLGGGTVLWGPITELLSFKQSEHPGRTVTIPKMLLVQACVALLNDASLRDAFLWSVSGKEHEKAQLRRVVKARVASQSGGIVQHRIKNPTPGVRRIVQFLEKKKSGNGYVIKVKYNNQFEEWIKRSAVPRSILSDLEGFEKLWDATMSDLLQGDSHRNDGPPSTPHQLHTVTLNGDTGHRPGAVVDSRDIETMHRQHTDSVLAGLPPPPGVMDPDLGKAQKDLHGADSVSPAGMDYWSPLEELQATTTRPTSDHDGSTSAGGPVGTEPSLPASMEVSCGSPEHSHEEDDGVGRKRRRKDSDHLVKRKRTDSH